MKRQLKNPNVTDKTRIVHALRKLFLQSRERAAVMKRDNYTCQKCHRKQTMKKGQEFKVQCHHKAGVLNWDKLVEEIRRDLLCDPSLMECLCKECHKNEQK